MDPTDTCTVTVDSLSYGRAAVARADGRVLFIEAAAPGDRIRVEITRAQSRWAEARIVDLISPGSTRVTPPCHLASTCGGCPWQHVSYDAQLKSKRQAVIDVLERIAGIDATMVEDIVPSTRTLGYRNRIKLRFDHGRMGFYRAASHSVIAIDDCLVADDRVRQALPATAELASFLATRITRIEIASRGELPGVVVALNSAGRLRIADRERIKTFIADRTNPVRGVAMWGKGWNRAWGDTRRRFTVDGAGTSLELQGNSFGQINSDGNLVLVDLVSTILAPRSSDTVVDLYAGAGNFALPLARTAGHIIAVEADADAVAAGRRAAEHHRLERVRFVHERVERFLTQAQPVPDRLLINPPRGGLGAAAAAAAALGAAKVAYVSCDPATLARDLVAFRERGYSVTRVVPIDMFPHTFHVETVCGLTC